MVNKTVFNVNNRDHMKTRLFLEDRDNSGLSIQRFDTQKYPVLNKLLNTQIGFFWRPEEVSLGSDVSNFTKMSETEKHILLMNIRRQVMLDSVMGRAPDMVFGPAISEPTLETLVKAWSFIECIHSLSYSYIIRTVCPDPESVMGNILDIPNIVQSSSSITHYYDHCISSIDRYYTDKSFDRRAAVRAIYLAMHTANSLESIRFAISFACSFAFAETGKTPGIGNIMKLIQRDESLHVAITNNLLLILPRDDEDFLAVSKEPEVKSAVFKIWKDVVDEELDWIKYLFSSGSILGLNEEVLTQYLCYTANNRFKSLGLGEVTSLGIPLVTKNPMTWINGWLSSDDSQAAPQESELTNYEKGVVDLNISNTHLSSMSEDLF